MATQWWLWRTCSCFLYKSKQNVIGNKYKFVTLQQAIYKWLQFGQLLSVILRHNRQCSLYNSLYIYTVLEVLCIPHNYMNKSDFTLLPSILTFPLMSALFPNTAMWASVTDELDSLKKSRNWSNQEGTVCPCEDLWDSNRWVNVSWRRKWQLFYKGYNL